MTVPVALDRTGTMLGSQSHPVAAIGGEARPDVLGSVKCDQSWTATHRHE